MEALARGADGVIVGGCRLGECHYQVGNYKANKRFEIFKKLLADLGFEPDRVKTLWISGSEGQKLAQEVTAFSEHIQKLGPNPLKVS